ncbi:hypothetical protein BC833DRAFT_91790 [Globomyces pollinis-pini]|nr:hypothetical protein BC833DRAFT_91790 [Globomyces pollinis-pini]
MISKLPKVDKEIPLHPLGNPGTPVTLGTLYQSSPCLIFAIRNPFCILCRRTTYLMKQQIHKFKEFNVKVYCVIKEMINDEQLDLIHFDKSEVFIDLEMNLFKILGDADNRFRRTSSTFVFSHKVWTNVYNATKEGFRMGYSSGEHFILGGSLLLSELGEIIYKSLENTPGEMPDIKGLLEASEALYHQYDAADDYQTAISPESFLSLGMDFSKIG